MTNIISIVFDEAWRDIREFGKYDKGICRICNTDVGMWWYRIFDHYKYDHPDIAAIIYLRNNMGVIEDYGNMSLGRR